MEKLKNLLRFTRRRPAIPLLRLYLADYNARRVERVREWAW